MAKKSKARAVSKRVNKPGEPAGIISEIMQFPAHLVPQLPLAVSLWLEVPGAPVPICFTTEARAGEPDTTLAPVIVFHRDELAALVVGAESERLWRKELLGFCFEKWHRPALQISAVDVLGGANASECAEAWSLGQVLTQLGATLLRVELSDARTEQPLMSVAA
jgi:hypothetical protein